jgi:hypothetical protein
MEWLLGFVGVVGIVVLTVVLLERLANRSLPRPSSESGESAGVSALGDLIEVFQPSRVHVTEELERRRLDIVQRPAEGEPFEIDLDSGVVVLPPTSSKASAQE